MNIEMALKSGSYILDLNHVKSSLGIFFLLSCLIEMIFHQLSGSTFIFVKNTHRKAGNLMFFLISPVAKTPALFLEGQSKSSSSSKSLRRFKASTVTAKKLKHRHSIPQITIF